jgi:predicted RNA polymerase sigma factor
MRGRRRETAAALEPVGREPAAGPGSAGYQAAFRDVTLILLFLCCHPALSPPSQLTLRAVGGLTTAEIAAAFLVPEATMRQRIRRAKQRIRSAGAWFELPQEPERSERFGVVLHVLYIIFDEGYAASSGPALHRADLTAEAIRLAPTPPPAAGRGRGGRAARADAGHGPGLGSPCSAPLRPTIG